MDTDGVGNGNIDPNIRQQHQKKKKFTWYLKAPIRALGRVKDLYINSMIRCGDGRNYGGAIGAYPSTAISRSSSVHTNRRSDEDFLELVRAVSQRKLGSEIPPSGVVPRSQSVAFGRIDEDRAMEFDGDAVPGVPFYPRSRSAAPTTRNQRMHV